MSRDTAKFEQLFDRAVLGMMLCEGTKREADIHEKLADAVHTSRHTIADWLKASRPRLPKQDDLENLVSYVVQRDGMASILDQSWVKSVFTCDSDYRLSENFLEQLFPGSHGEGTTRPTLPPPVDFVGREVELADYALRLKRDRFVGLSGMTGVGKSALARQLAEEWIQRHKLPERVFWHEFHLNDAEGVIEKLAQFLAYHKRTAILERLRHSEKNNVAVKSREVLGQLASEISRGRYLICLDNIHAVADSEEVDFFLGKLLDGLTNETYSLIVAGQQRPAKLNERRFERYRTEPLIGLSVDDAKLLLGTMSLRDNLIDQLHHVTGGNAELLMLLKGWIDPNNLVDGLLTELASVESINDFVMHKIHDGLTPGQNQIMEVLSIFNGHPGSRQAVEFILSGQNVIADLRSLKERHLVQELVTEDGRLTAEYTIHEIVRGFYYGLLGEGQRRRFHKLAGDYYMAEENTLRAMQHLEEAEEWQKLAELVTAEAKSLVYSGHLRRVEQVLGELLSHSDELGDTVITSYFRTMGYVKRISGKYSLALHYYRMALDTVQNDIERGHILFDIGHTYQEQGKFKQEINSHQLSQESFRLAQDRNGEAKAIVGMGRAYYHSGDLNNAFHVTSEGAQLAKKVGDGFLVARTDLLLGLIDWRHGRLDDAETRFKNAIKTFDSLNEVSDMCHATMNLGILEGARGNLDGELKYLNRAKEQGEKIGDVATLRLIYQNLGNNYLESGEPQQSIDCYQKLIEHSEDGICDPLLIRAYAGIAESYILLNKLDISRTHAAAAMELAAQGNIEAELGIVFRVQGEIAYAEEDYARAKDVFERSIVLLEKVQDYDELAAAQDGLNRTYANI